MSIPRIQRITTEPACPFTIDTFPSPPQYPSTHRSGSSCFSTLTLSMLLGTLRVLYAAANP